MTQDRDPLRFDAVADAVGARLEASERDRLRLRLRRMAQAAPEDFLADLRRKNLDAGRINVDAGSVHWLPVADWDPARNVVSRTSGRHVFITLLEARRPGAGAFARLIDGLSIEQLVPVVIAPTGPMRPILESWRWQKTSFGTTFETKEDRWSPSKSWLTDRAGLAMLREKARYGDGCNNCGHCCRAAPQACALGASVFRTAEGSGPCPALRLLDPSNGRAAVCGLALDPASYVACGTLDQSDLAAAARMLIGATGICDAAMTGERIALASKLTIESVKAEIASTGAGDIARAHALWSPLRARKDQS
jgi:hypothetical protein